jgi:hypothetical protein
MSAGKDDKQARTGQGAGKAASSKVTKPPKPQAKEEDTRFSTIVDTREGGKKKDGGAGPQDRPRDGS